MTHHLKFIALVAVICCGCSRNQSANTGLQTELDNIARCFEHSVFLLQETPTAVEDIAKFMERGKAAASKTDEFTETCDFSRLKWNQDRTRIRVSSGQNVHCSIGETEHDNLDSGTAFRTSYKFKLPNTPFHSQATAELSIPN